MKKQFLTTGIAFAVLTAFSTPTWADYDPFSGVVAAIQQLGVEVQAISVASSKGFNDMMYQLDQNLVVAMQANSQSNSAQLAAKNSADSMTNTQLSSSLMQFPEQIVNASQLSNSQMATDITNRQHLLENLTTNTPASDTLYLDTATNPLAAEDNVGPPTALNDDYFNADSLLTPSAYNDPQEQAAQSYLEYVTQAYSSLINGIDFDKLKSKLNNLSPADRAQALQNFVTNPVYQKYQLAVRSLMAAKSIALSNLNLLMAERTPVKDLATNAGIPNDPNLPAGYASPLEVENYIANERVNNPQWFQQIKTASPAAVQREEVLILAEIENELERNHLDNERLLATLSISTLQSTQASQLVLQSKAQDVNQIIDPKANQGAR